MRVNGDERRVESPCSARLSQPSPMRNLTSASGGLFVSAPGKIILFGEHAVVYGRTAVAGSIDLRTYVSLFTSADGRIYLSLPDLGVEKTWLLKDLLKAGERLAAEQPPDESQAPSLELLVPMARKLSGACEDQCGVQHLAILAFWYVLLGVAQRKKDLLAVKTTVRFELPSCVGLGSSGAFCVCIVASLLQSSSLIPPPSIVADSEGNLTWEDEHLDMIRKWAAAAESLIHGRASGLDAAVCTYGHRRYGWQSFSHLAFVTCYGGVASFKPGTRIEHLKNLPDLRVILVNSKVERNTSRMVQCVKERMKKFPEVVEGVFTSIDAISREAAVILGKASCSENGEIETPCTPVLNGGAPASSSGQPHSNLPDGEHRSLQPHSRSARSASLSSYVSGGKRDSCASAISTSSQCGDTFTKLNELCRINNQLLIALGVGHPTVDRICTLLSRYGIHPKMTGAGGGGSLYAFLKPDTPQMLLDMIIKDLTDLGYDVWQPPLGGPGVIEHARRPALFATTSSSATSAHSTPSLHHK